MRGSKSNRVNVREIKIIIIILKKEKKKYQKPVRLK